MELSGPADFGVTVADGKVLTQEVFVANEGSLTGEFKIRYNGNQPITIMPSGGIIKPRARQSIKVSCISNKDSYNVAFINFSVPKLKHKCYANMCIFGVSLLYLYIF